MARIGWRDGVRRWWRAPAALEVLVGSDRYSGAIIRAFALFVGQVGVFALPITLLTPDAPGFRRALIAAAIATALVLVVLALVIDPQLRAWQLEPMMLLAAGGIGAAVPLFGPRLAEASVLAAASTGLATLWVPRRWAVGTLVLGGVTYAGSLKACGLDVPLARWLIVMATLAALLVAVARVLDMVIDLAAEERAAQAEVAELNRTLGDQVRTQVAEIEALGELRRFLSPQVADAVLEAGGTRSAALQPHRRRIAVVFCDLRGFTAFSNSTEPEYVLEVLDEYYQVVGGALRRHGATVGAFQGDGIMAYFNDPVPCDDPAGTALAMVHELRRPLDDCTDRWARKGYGLGYGCGVAYGYATLGTVGFEGRSDYTPLGPVVNLASRLCDEAARGEVLLDAGMHAALSQPVPAQRCELPLKGFDRPIIAYRMPPLTPPAQGLP